MSDAAQKPMEHDAADMRPECDCSAGKTCPVKGVIDSTFKQRYRDQMIELMTTVINAASDPNHDCTGDTKRVTNLKNEMDDARDLTGSWGDLARVSIGSKVPICITTRKIMAVMSKCSGEFGVTEVLGMCTYVTDVCTSLISKNDDTEICEIIETLVDFILARDILVCVNFLFWLDRL